MLRVGELETVALYDVWCWRGNACARLRESGRSEVGEREEEATGTPGTPGSGKQEATWPSLSPSLPHAMTYRRVPAPPP